MYDRYVGGYQCVMGVCEGMPMYDGYAHLGIIINVMQYPKYDYKDTEGNYL